MLNFTLKERLLVSAIGSQQPKRRYIPKRKGHSPEALAVSAVLLALGLVLSGAAIYSTAPDGATTAPMAQR